jgi:hypothetical protein
MCPEVLGACEYGGGRLLACAGACENYHQCRCNRALREP